MSPGYGVEHSPARRLHRVSGLFPASFGPVSGLISPALALSVPLTPRGNAAPEPFRSILVALDLRRAAEFEPDPHPFATGPGDT